MDEERDFSLDEERDVVVFEDDAGNEIKMEVIDYLAYEGKEYALLTEFVEDEETEPDEDLDVYIMEVVDAGDDMEEFVPVEDEALANQLLAIFESDDFDDDALFDDEEEE